MNFALYMIGALVLVLGVAYGASRLGLSSTWITVICAVIIGLAIMGGVTKTRMKDPPQ